MLPIELSGQTADLMRGAAIYLPLLAAAVGRLITGPKPRLFAASLLSLLWTLPSLLMLQMMNQQFGWWSFEVGSEVLFRGMPLELLLGWTILWSLLPQMTMARLGIGWSAVVLVALDCLLMPLCGNLVHLQRYWMLGELIGAVLVLGPSLAIGYWTQAAGHLLARVTLQIATSGMVFLFLVPELIFSLTGGGWACLEKVPDWALQVSIQLLLLLALPGVSAALEFAERGLGTPIPYDAPSKLVTSGMYCYLANPMQLSCAMVMLAAAALLCNGWMLLAAMVSVVYSAGIANWDEKQDLIRRFGDDWRRYRQAVRNWVPRWRPHHSGAPATLYIARTCGACSEVRLWLEVRRPIGLEIKDAESLPQGSVRRMRYQTSGISLTGQVDGVRAMGRALEHLNLGWALCGAAMRLPVIWQSLQLLMDASGLGPRQIRSDSDLQGRAEQI